KGYGTIISTGTITVNGKNFEIKNTYSLGQNDAFVKITVKVTNKSGSTVSNIRYWIGTRDDYVKTTDRPNKFKGNLYSTRP
ncbi:MAG: hypothetical protein AABZ78_11075, partial [Chloroflexota bacterium]